MSIQSKHAYRFGYLQSEQWQNVRIEALARESGKCQVCGEESIGNDAHHVWYPDNIYQTTQEHLVILCRSCHTFIHEIRPECKTRDESKGRAEWQAFLNAILAWRAKKLPVFSNGDGIKYVNPVTLNETLMRLKQKLQQRQTVTKQEVGAAFTEIRKLIK